MIMRVGEFIEKLQKLEDYKKDYYVVIGSHLWNSIIDIAEIKEDCYSSSIILSIDKEISTNEN